MKTYIYKVTNSSPKRGYNRSVTVYRVKRNTPEYVGTEHVNTAAYSGNWGTATRIVRREEGDRSRHYKLIEV